jgi:hypothetical protein
MFVFVAVRFAPFENRKELIWGHWINYGNYETSYAALEASLSSLVIESICGEKVSY